MTAHATCHAAPTGSKLAGGIMAVDESDWDQEFCEFLDYVTERRISRDGRFLRVDFKTGFQADLIPQESLADGTEICKDGRLKSGWGFVSLSIEKLWQDYRG